MAKTQKTEISLRGEIIELNKITLCGRFRGKDGREWAFDASSSDNPEQLIADFAKKETVFMVGASPSLESGRGMSSER